MVGVDGVPGASRAAGAALRPASTLMVVRDAPAGHRGGDLEVLMLRRSLRSDFVGGAYVFPGGALDPGDGGEAAAACSDGLDDAVASRTLGVGSGGLAYWVAAVRESFEEAGVLLARERPGGQVVSFADPARADRFARHRRAVNAKDAAFLDVVRAEGLRLALDRIHYVAHWITPEGAPRRYDTRFFLAVAPEGQVAAHDAGETISDVWVRPADALARHRAGSMALVLPTIRSLETLAASPTTSALLEAVGRIGDVRPVLPRLVAGASGATLLLPGDPGYDDPSLAPPERADPETLARASRGRAGLHP